MAQILPPTVHERLARCNERVFVDGIVPGALVELQVGTAVTSAVVASGGHTFAFYAAMMVLQLYWVLKYMPETKQIPLEQIQQQLGIE